MRVMIMAIALLLSFRAYADSTLDFESLIGMKKQSGNSGERFPDELDIEETTINEFHRVFNNSTAIVGPRTLAVANILLGEIFRESIQVEDVRCTKHSTQSFLCSYRQTIHVVPTQSDPLYELAIAAAPTESSGPRIDIEFVLKNSRWTSPSLRDEYASLKAARAASSASSSYSGSTDSDRHCMSTFLMTPGEAAMAGTFGCTK